MSASMISQPAHPVMYATLLTVLAGFLDAAAYSELNHLYVSFMSGNSTHMGIALASSDFQEVAAVAVIVGAFVLGASVGTWIADVSETRRLTTILTVEALLLTIASTLSFAGSSYPALVLVAVSMGMQNAMHQIVAGADVGRSFITGALFRLGFSIARLLRGKGGKGQVTLNLLSWTAFVGGAILGAFAILALGLQICLLAAAILILAMLGALLTQRL